MNFPAISGRFREIEGRLSSVYVEPTHTMQNFDYKIRDKQEKV